MTTNSVIVKSTVISLIIIISGFSCYFLSLRLSSQIYDLRAGKLLNQGSPIAAIKMLEKATRLRPSEYQLHNKLASAYKQLALTKSDPKYLKQFMGKSQLHFLTAMQLNPFDAHTVFNLALVEP